MIEPGEHTELSEEEMARKVRDYLGDRRPGGVTLQVDPHGVHRGEFGWRVLVRPDKEPADLIEYYDGLVDIEMELEERDHLNVWLVTAAPETSPPAEQPPSSGAKKPAGNAAGPRRTRGLRTTK